MSGLAQPAQRGNHFRKHYCYTDVSTEDVCPAERFDYWRSTVLLRSDADRLELPQRTAFHGARRGFAGLAGSIHEVRNDPVVMRRTWSRCRADGSDEIQLIATMEGKGSCIYQQGGAEAVVSDGELLILDLARPLVAKVGQRRQAVLRVPRAAVAGALALDPARIGMRKLRASPRISLLLAHFRALVDHLSGLDDDARQAALHATIDLSLAMLAREVQAEAMPVEAQSAGMFVAAKRFIAQHLADPGLSPDSIARRLRCSRTQLYRIFGTFDLSVMEYVRTMRLERARSLLEHPANLGRSIAEIGHACGFEDPSVFSRSFRRCFGLSPSEFREERTATNTSLSP